MLCVSEYDQGYLRRCCHCLTLIRVAQSSLGLIRVLLLEIFDDERNRVLRLLNQYALNYLDENRVNLLGIQILL